MSGDADCDRCHLPMYEDRYPAPFRIVPMVGIRWIELGVLGLDDVVDHSVTRQVATREEARPARRARRRVGVVAAELETLCYQPSRHGRSTRRRAARHAGAPGRTPLRRMFGAFPAPDGSPRTRLSIRAEFRLCAPVDLRGRT